MKILKVKILDVELEAALLNPKVAESYDRGFRTCVDRIQNAGAATENGVEGIKEQCNAVIDYIDEVFGVGASRKVLGEETDLLSCLDALEDMATLYETQVNPLIKEKTEKIKEALNSGGVKDDPV